MESLVRKLIEIANSQIGSHEEGGNNKGPQVVKYQKATWLEPGAWPWCMAFVAWIVQQWLRDKAVRAFFGIKDDAAAEKWRPRTAAAFGAEDWAMSRGLTVLRPPALAKAGDIIIFDFNGPAAGGGHIGFVVQDQEKPGDHIHTIEGNTGALGLRDAPTGDGVFTKERNTTQVKALVRMVA